MLAWVTGHVQETLFPMGLGHSSNLLSTLVLSQPLEGPWDQVDFPLDEFVNGSCLLDIHKS